MRHIFYHGSDLDGKLGGAIAKFYCLTRNLPYKLYPYSHSTREIDFSLIKDTDSTYFIDISPVAFLKDLKALTARSNTVLIDHHDSSIKLPTDTTTERIVSKEAAGCELAWKYFFPETVIPKFVEYISTYDRWLFNSLPEQKEKILSFWFGVQTEDTSPLTPDDIFTTLIDRYLTSNLEGQNIYLNIMQAGRAIYKYEKMAASVFKKRIFAATFEGLSTLVINSDSNSPFIFDEVFNPSRHDIMMRFTRGPEHYYVGIYSQDKSLDLDEIAKKYNGGGHCTAAGFAATGLVFTRSDAGALWVLVIPKEKY